MELAKAFTRSIQTPLHTHDTTLWHHRHDRLTRATPPPHHPHTLRCQNSAPLSPPPPPSQAPHVAPPGTAPSCTRTVVPVVAARRRRAPTGPHGTPPAAGTEPSPSSPAVRASSSQVSEFVGIINLNLANLLQVSKYGHTGHPRQFTFHWILFLGYSIYVSIAISFIWEIRFTFTLPPPSRQKCNPNIWEKNLTKSAILENRSSYLPN
jgi:hypothetical protein